METRWKTYWNAMALNGATESPTAEVEHTGGSWN